MRTFCYYNGFKVTIHKYSIQIRIKMIINMYIHLYISISFNDEHSSFECLFLDFVGHITSKRCRILHVIQFVSTLVLWCVKGWTTSKNKHAMPKSILDYAYIYISNLNYTQLGNTSQCDFYTVGQSLARSSCAPNHRKGSGVLNKIKLN